MLPSLICFAGAVLCCGLAAVVFVLKRRLLPWLFFGLGMILLAAEDTFAGLTLDAISPDQAVFWQQLRLTALALMPGTWLVFSLSYSRGNHAEFLKRWRVLLGFAYAIPLVAVAGFSKGAAGGVSIDGASGELFIGLGLPGRVVNLVLLVASVLILVNLERTFRSAIGIMRWRIKYFVLGVALLFGVKFYTSSQALLYGGLHGISLQINAVAVLVAAVLAGYSLLRSRLAESEIYPSHKVLQHSFTAVVAGIYLVGVGLLANFVKMLGGDPSFPIKALLLMVGLVGLTVLVLSDRVRQQIGIFVSRNFRRPTHDYPKVWSALTARTASMIDHTELCRAVVKAVSETFELLSVTIWRVSGHDQGLIFGASTSFTEEKAAAMLSKGVAEPVPAGETSHRPVPSGDSRPAAGHRPALRSAPLRGAAVHDPNARPNLEVEALLAETPSFRSAGSPTETGGSPVPPSVQGKTAELLEGLRTRSGPFDIDECKEKWVESLKDLNPDHFQKGGRRVCAPLVSGGELVGLITVADRVNGLGFSTEDLDLLKCIGDQVGGSLRNIQLSQKLMQNKEMQAFQTMSAFFVHDLKNTASTLSLMLQNLSVHFGNPAFREDCLKSVSRSVTHINDLVQRFGSLRHELELKKEVTDLNGLIRSAVTDLENQRGLTVVQDLQSVPMILADGEQLRKVVTNLLLNAGEALNGGGEIRVGTAQENGWVQFTVTDNGCGMSPEFVRSSLFRPFQTTKKSGLGIGMFHSKAIVEAHQGRVEVRSRLNEGTTFRVFLPKA